MKLSASIVTLSILASAAAYADQSACERIRDANVKTGSANVGMKTTGYNFAKDTPRVYGLGTHSCAYLRDEAVDGQAAAVFREQYQADSGNTDAMIWISKASGRLLREEQDGDIKGKGKGHISYRWTPANP